MTRQVLKHEGNRKIVKLLEMNIEKGNSRKKEKNKDTEEK